MSFGQKGIVGIGHILLDGIGSASEAFMFRFGALPSPAHVSSAFMEKFSIALEENPKLLLEPMSWSAGGGVAIMGKASRALGLGVDLWACAGNDRQGEYLKNELARFGIAFHSVASEKPTGIFCSLVTENGEKRIVVSPSAAKDIRGYSLPPEALIPGNVLYIDGLLIDSPEWLGELAGRAREMGMIIALDVSTPGNARRFPAEIVRFSAAFCDYVFANEEEFEALSTASGPGLSVFPKWIVKRGRQGAALVHGASRIETQALATKTIDDTGAGDAFAAGFLYGVLEGFDGETCLRMGNAAGSIALKAKGSAFDNRALSLAVDNEKRITLKQ